MTLFNGEIPEGWASAQFGDVVELKYGKTLTDKCRDGEGHPVYGSNGVVGYHTEALLGGPCLIVGRKGSIGEVHLCNGPCSPIDTTYYVDDFFGQPIEFWYYRHNCPAINRRASTDYGNHLSNRVLF